MKYKILIILLYFWLHTKNQIYKLDTLLKKHHFVSGKIGPKNQIVTFVDFINQSF
jgi:hypothetical protein